MSADPGHGPLQRDAEVLALRRQGDYHVLTLAVGPIAARVRPGNFIAIAVGGEGTSMLLRRAFSIYAADPSGPGTLQIVFAEAGKGTHWMTGVRRGDHLNVIAPLGQPFRLPSEPVACALVGGGYGSAPLFSLAEQLRARGCRVDMVLGAATADRVFGELEGRRGSASLTVTTDDGSAGLRGRVTDALGPLMDEHGTDVVYACGPMPMLSAVARMAAERGAHSQCAVEEAMACGVGVCMTCVLPVIGKDGLTRMVRSCTDGPVFFGDRVRWSDVGTVPADAVGAPGQAPGGGH